MNIPSDTQAGVGYLIIHATTARGSIPLEGARVEVRDRLPEFLPERGDVLYSVVTGRDGNTVPLSLSAPSRQSSMTPSDTPPFTTYLVTVQAEGYYSQQYINVPIFDGITAIQPADLIPLPEGGDLRSGDTERFFENTAPNL